MKTIIITERDDGTLEVLRDERYTPLVGQSEEGHVYQMDHWTIAILHKEKVGELLSADEQLKLEAGIMAGAKFVSGLG